MILPFYTQILLVPWCRGLDETCTFRNIFLLGALPIVASMTGLGLFALALATGFSVTMSAPAAGLADIDHVVLFMQGKAHLLARRPRG